MKVVTVLGTRPELIRLALLISELDQHAKHVLVHTGQNSDPKLSDVFFREMRIRKPDYMLGITGAGFGAQVGRMLTAVDEVLEAERPDALLILGDTNSGLSAMLAKRRRIPVFHMEAGNRCFDDRVPEEVNRRIIDQSSTVLMPYTQRSRENLLREGIATDRIVVIGNPIFEILQHYAAEIDAADTLERLGLRAGEFFLVTMHRAETVDVESRLSSLVRALESIRAEYDQPVVCSLHPRTRDRMAKLGVRFASTSIQALDPLGFFDFVKLEKTARCVVTDSGTVQEECSILRVPSVTVRDVTERPETIEAGSNVLAGVDPETILRVVRTVLAHPPDWEPPAGYLERNVARKVAKIILGRAPSA